MNALKVNTVESRSMFITDRQELKRKVDALRELGNKIVLTQGAYDMIHTGHLRYLEKAKSQGDVLIVAIDTDELVKARKGEDRPFDPEVERFETISRLRGVDIVVPKTLQEDKHDIIKLINPDIFVISRSTGPEIQKDEEEFGAMCGGVVNLEPQSSNSTTAKFRKLKAGHGKELKEKLNGVIDEFINGGDSEDSDTEKEKEEAGS